MLLNHSGMHELSTVYLILFCHAAQKLNIEYKEQHNNCKEHTTATVFITWGGVLVSLCQWCVIIEIIPLLGPV